MGLIVIALGVVLFLPLPFMNPMPGLALVILGMGLASKDGVVTILAASLCAGLVLVVSLAAKQLHALSDGLMDWLRVLV